MTANDKIDRRTIRDRLVKDTGWEVVSHLDGTIDVWAPSGHVTSSFRDEIARRVKEMEFEPRFLTAIGHNNTFVRFHTAETLAQRGRGAHTK